VKYFSSDWHLGHDKVLEMSKRPFDSIDKMHEHLWAQIESLQRGDEIYFMGDLGKYNDIIFEFFNRLPKRVNFHWVVGNHDYNYKKFESFCTSQTAMRSVKIEGNHVVLCHYPMITWDRSHYGSWQLFGHHHVNYHGTADLEKHAIGKQLNVNWEFHNYKLLSEKDIVEIMATKPDNWDLIRRK
jgi:calcineurin-like phosphoesterase family protein